jgi:hypothetical protein
MIMNEGEKSPHDDGGVIVMINGRNGPRAYCTGCGGPLDDGDDDEL